MGLAVPVGFIAVATGWAWLAALGGWLLGISRVIVGWHAAVEPNWRIPTPPVWLGVAVSLALIALAAARGRRWRAVAGGAAALLLALLLWHPFPPDQRAGQLEVTAIDVGQGDALLVVFPDGKRMLVDAGGIPSFGGTARSQMEIGEDVVAPYLWNRGFRTVDVVALTHAHEDHAGGLPALVADFHPRELWTGVMADTPAWKAVREAARRAGTRIVPLAAPARIAFGGASIEVLAPEAGSEAVPGAPARNDDSLVLALHYGVRSFLLTGDIERPVERRLAFAPGELRRTDVLKVAHHGSRTSSTPEFLDAVSPAFAVISAGLDNSYGDPAPSVLDRLAERHAAVYRTDRDGQVVIRTDGRKLEVETFR
jgi:competence protein ComEC